MLPVLNLFLDRRSSTLTAWSFSLAMRRNRSDKGAGTPGAHKERGFYLVYMQRVSQPHRMSRCSGFGTKNVTPTQPAW